MTVTHESHHIDAPKGTQAIIRAIHLLKAVAAAEQGSSLTELATDLKLSPSTTHRILSALESEGLVAHHLSSHRYTLGSAALTIGAHALQKSDIRALARPLLLHLASESGETASLEVPVEGQMLILDEVAGSQIVGARVEVGTRWPVFATSTGKALLAELSNEALEVRLCHTRSRFTPETLVGKEELHADILATRERGYAIASGELEPGYVAVGAAVTDRMGLAVAALSIGGPVERLSPDTLGRLGDLVVNSASELSNLLAAR